MVDKGHPGKPQWTRDSDWDREMSFIVPGETELGQVAGLAASLAPRSAETSVVSCQGNPVYVKVVFRDEDPERSDRAASELRRSAEPPKGFRIGGYGSEVLFLPAGVSKEMAVKRLMEGRFKGADLTVGAGDSGDDLGFMEMCDYNIIPKNTNIWRKTHA